MAAGKQIQNMKWLQLGLAVLTSGMRGARSR